LTALPPAGSDHEDIAAVGEGDPGAVGRPGGISTLADAANRAPVFEDGNRIESKPIRDER
jgi:hypothetical protein